MNSAHPPRVALDLGGKQLVFVRVHDDRYAPELAGERRPIRTREDRRTCSETGRSEPLGSNRSDGAVASIDPALRCLALGARPTAIAEGVQLSATDNWGHFRQNTSPTLAITIAGDGAIEIAADIREQDESYY
jgi:hypothetical protein